MRISSRKHPLKPQRTTPTNRGDSLADAVWTAFPGRFTARLEDKKQFNPHRSRSGSVQRILSAMLRQGSHSFHEHSAPKHCG